MVTKISKLAARLLMTGWYREVEGDSKDHAENLSLLDIRADYPRNSPFLLEEVNLFQAEDGWYLESKK